MDDRRFDGLTKAFASGRSRRGLLNGLLGLSAAALPTLGRVDGSTDAARRSKPTPKPIECPGIQTWDGAECTCPSGFLCGPTCCEAPEQCCDSACCDAGAVCVAEEQCCPIEQVCPNYPGGPCCPDGTICCASGDACYDPNGGCCNIDDCPTEFCNPVACQSNVCIYAPLLDGTDCGDCLSCQSGACTSTCATGETCCPEDATCVDLSTGGCCGDDNCPADPDPCPGVCRSHQCEASDSVSCHSSTGDLVCCADGSECTEWTGISGDMVGICCATGLNACATLEGPVCCADESPCVEIAVLGGISFGVCCASETAACLIDAGGLFPTGTCCASGTQCFEVGEFQDNSLGLCCASEEDVCLTPAGSVCCTGETVCTEYSGQTTGPKPGLCCESGLPVCYVGSGLGCCPSGRECKPLTAQNLPLELCCATNEAACWTRNGTQCCPAGQICVPNEGCVAPG